MFPYISIFRLKLPMYGTCILAGILITIACVACIGAGAAALASDPSFMDMLNSL